MQLLVYGYVELMFETIPIDGLTAYLGLVNFVEVMLEMIKQIKDH